MQVVTRSRITPLRVLKTQTEHQNLRLAFSTSEGLHLLHWTEIVHCIAQSNYCRICCTDGSTLFVSKTLKVVEEALPHGHFIRVHKSHLIQIEYIRVISQDEIVLNDQKRIPLARSRRRELLARLQRRIHLVS